MPDGREFPCAGRVTATALAALLGESAVLAGWLAGMLAPGLALAAHAAICAGAAACVARRQLLEQDARAPVLLLAPTAFLGPFGPAGTLFAMGLTLWFRRRAVPFETWYESLFPGMAENPREAESARLALAVDDGRDVAAFADVLAGGAPTQKQALIFYITRNFRPAFGPVLVRALSDGNHGIRVQAATAINQLENGFFRQSVELEGKAGSSLAALRELARHYDEYSYSGILDPGRLRVNRELALSAWQRYLEQEPGDGAARLAVGRLLLRQRQFELAREWFEESCRLDPGNPALAGWRMESLFECGRYDELRAAARSLAAADPQGEGPAEALAGPVRFWAGQEG